LKRDQWISRRRVVTRLVNRRGNRPQEKVSYPKTLVFVGQRDCARLIYGVGARASALAYLVDASSRSASRSFPIFGFLWHVL
jgi:hypothetical protein